jgi:hypothetical protein
MPFLDTNALLFWLRTALLSVTEDNSTLVLEG